MRRLYSVILAVICFLLAACAPQAADIEALEGRIAELEAQLEATPTPTRMPTPSPTPRSTPTPEPEYDLGKVNWGMSREEVMDTEPGMQKGEDGAVYHSGYFMGKKAGIIYSFDSSERLVAATYVTMAAEQIAEATDEEYLKYYLDLLDYLEYEYGEPIAWAEKWNDNGDQLSMDFEDAVMDKKAYFEAVYRTDKYEIIIDSGGYRAGVETTFPGDIVVFMDASVGSYVDFFKYNFYMTAKNLYSIYDKNSVAADLKYKGNRILISGKISAIDTDLLGTPYVIIYTDKYGGEGVQCYFNNPNQSRLSALKDGSTGIQAVAPLKKGQEIMIIGKCKGMEIFYVALDECEIYTDE